MQHRLKWVSESIGEQDLTPYRQQVVAAVATEWLWGNGRHISLPYLLFSVTVIASQDTGSLHIKTIFRV
jgi:hypothetical protein